MNHTPKLSFFQHTEGLPEPISQDEVKLPDAFGPICNIYCTISNEVKGYSTTHDTTHLILTSFILNNRLYYALWYFYKNSCNKCEATEYIVGCNVNSKVVDTDFDRSKLKEYLRKNLYIKDAELNNGFTIEHRNILPCDQFIDGIDIDSTEKVKFLRGVCNSIQTEKVVSFTCYSCEEQEKFKKWEEQKFNEVSSEHDCLICREQTDDKLFCMHCINNVNCNKTHHVMHKDCAIQYFEGIGEYICPMCKQKVDSLEK